jgi:hypothetical protein
MKNPMRNKKFPSIAAIFAVAIALFFAAESARAADNDLIITEIMYDPKGSDTRHEWIEIYNSSSDEILIKGGISSSSWRLIDQFQDDLPVSGHKHTFLADITINSHEFAIISSSPDVFQNDHPGDDFSGKIIKSSFLLPNDGSSIAISSNGANTWFSSVDYSSGLGANDNAKTLERSDLEENDWQESCEDDGTPGEEPKICETETAFVDEDINATNLNDDSANAPEKCATTSTNIKLNEIFPYPESGDEFVEITNTGGNCVDISGWKVMDEAGHKKIFPENSIIEPGEYLFLEGNLYLNNDSDTAYLLDANGNAKNDALDKVFYEKAKEKYSYALSNGSFSWTSDPTPGEKNVFDAPVIEASIEASMENSSDSDGDATNDGNIFLNEILPNPKDGSDNEYIEIANGDVEPVDLFGWRVKDSSESKGYQFKDHVVLNPDEYLAIHRPDSKIALNNSDESVYLYDPKNEIASSVSFDKSIKNSSYNFDGKTWKWSKYLTPGKENKFDSEPSVKVTKPKHVYKDIFTEFSAKAKDKETKKLKYSWDFGDGKKSSLAKTSHKYLDTGKYTVTLAVSDESQTVEKSFSIKAKKSPRPNIEITKIVPNPVGNDSEGEIVEIKNNSKKKIDLTGWKIATGSGEKTYNHPISGEISVDPNGTETITREFSKFSLNNEAGKVQLAGPDGKVIDEVEYSKEKIAEDEAYAKIDGEWMWIEPGAPDENADEAGAVDEESGSEEAGEENTVNNGEVLGAADEDPTTSLSQKSYFSSEDAFIFLTDIGFLKSQNEEINYCPLKNTTASLEYFLISSI